MYRKYVLSVFKTSSIANQLQDGLKKGLWEDFKRLSLRTFSAVNDPIKGPRTPYIIYSNEKMAELRNNNSALKATEMGKMIGEMWNNLSDKEKKPFEAKYLEEKSLYVVKLEKQMSAMTEEEKDEIAKGKSIKKDERKMKKMKLLLKKHDKPVAKGINPFILFSLDKLIDRGDAPLKMYVQGIADMWKKLPEEDKKPYIDRSRKNSLIYKKETLRWEQGMVASGHHKLLSKHKQRMHFVHQPEKKDTKTKRGSKGKNSEAGEDETE